MQKAEESEDGRDDQKGLEDSFAAMSVSKVLFNLPHLVYKWLDQIGNGFLQVDLLMLSGTTCKEDVNVEIVPDGKLIKVKQRVPNLFLHPCRLSNIQAKANDEEVDGSKISAAMNKAVNNYREQFSDPTSDTEVEMVIKLPEHVEPKFADPNTIETYANDYRTQRRDDANKRHIQDSSYCSSVSRQTKSD